MKAIIFDYGKVLVNFDNWKFVKKISKNSKLNPIQIFEIIYVTKRLQHQYELGKISSNEFYQMVCEECDVKMSISDFKMAFTDIFTPIAGMYPIVKKLKKKYKVALVSNTNPWDFKESISKSKVFHLFDSYCVSFKEKSMKPSTKMFKSILKKLNVKANEAAFVDDVLENVDAARKIGIKGIHFRELNDFKKKLNELIK